jgi:hypothetical protein
VAKRFLLTRTRQDYGNQYLYAYSEELIREAKDRGWKVDRAEDENATQAEVASRLTKIAHDFILFNGHGTPSGDAIYGHGEEKVIDTGSTGLLAKKIVYARSCGVLEALGASAAGNGCAAFIGYVGDFYIPRVNEYESVPLRDPSARPVLEVSNMIGKLILKGDSVMEAMTAAQRRAEHLLLKMLSSGEPYDSASFKALYNNYLNLAYRGNADARV